MLAATDPAQPYGGALPWPPSGGRPARAAGSMVILVEGEAVAYLDRSGRSLVTFPKAADDDRWVEALAGLVKDGRLRSLELQRIDGDPSAPVADRAPIARRRVRRRLPRARAPIVIHRERVQICCPEGDGSGTSSLLADA